MTEENNGFPGGFTVLMAVYHKDNPALFSKAIESACANTLAPDDFILVVDGPIGTALTDIIKHYADAGVIRPLYLERNAGLPNALNQGLALVRTDWVARADADDFNTPERFQRQADAVRTNALLGLVGSAILEVDEHGSPIANRNVPLSHADIQRYAAKRNPMNHMTVVFRAPLARAVGGYPNVYGREDYCLWAAMIANGAKAQNLPEPLVHATTGMGMYRRRGGTRHVHAELQLQVHLWRNRLKSLPSAVIDGLLRTTVALAPASLRQQIYVRLLRKPAQ